MELVAIKRTLKENDLFVNNPDCQESLYMSLDYYKKVGFKPPWIGYYVKREEQFVGVGAFKGRPVDGKVEIAYGTFERFRKKGIGTEICRMLVELSLKTDPSVVITARTLPENNYSTRILEKNDFELLGTIIDPEDGEVWEWKYKNPASK